jgi:transcriptional regulator with PAS, ATPase and Fis domain
MKNDLNDLKRVTKELMGDKHQEIDNEKVINHFIEKPAISIKEEVEETEEETFLTLQEQEKILIEKALQRHQGRRKDAAEELGISERTLYRKIKEYLL